MYASIDTLWLLVGTMLVFFMQAGFSLLETGFTRLKNTGHILLKNLISFCIAIVAFWVIGFGFLFGPDVSGFIGAPDLFAQGAYSFTVPTPVFLLFQMMLAALVVTIVTGALAERAKFLAYCLISLILSALVYPIAAHWIWGGGWLAQAGFVDVAGASTLHLLGGFSALIGAKILGPRLGK